jgi:acyl-CoA thioesterase I
MLRTKIMPVLILATIISGCGNEQKKETGAGKPAANPADTASAAKEAAERQQNILFFGTSLTAGYGVDPTEAYPALIQKKIDSLHLHYKVINGGLSGETSAAGRNRIDWLLKQHIDIFVLELGANDGLRGLPLRETRANLQAVIDKVKKKYPEIKMVMLGMQMPPNLGADYTAEFKALFSDLATKNNMTYVPFLLDGVGGVSKLNQQDGIHPTAEGHQILAQNVWSKLQGIL